MFWLALLAGPAACVVLAALPTIGWAPALPRVWLPFALLVLAYPVVEEWLFRGELQPLLARWQPAHWGPLTRANFITSVGFAALHLFFHPPLWALAVFLPSLVFGYFRERSGGLLAPILLHGSYNASYFLLLAGT